MLKVTCYFLYIAASVIVKTCGDGTTDLTCSAQGVINMQWSVSYFGMTQNIDLNTILDSATEDFTVTDGITLSSTFNSGNIESTIRVISQSGKGVQYTWVTFVCSGKTQFGGNFWKGNAIVAALANSTTPSEVPETSPSPTGKLQHCRC